MTTVATKDAVFLHVPKTGGTTATLALAELNLVEYDYRFHKVRPHEHDLVYDHECRLCLNGEIIGHPPNSNPHARASQLRLEDSEKQKIMIIRQPHDWYVSFWSHHKKFNWSFTSGMPEKFLKGGAKDNFHKWMQNIVQDSSVGFCTRYFKLYGYDQSLLVRLETLATDWRVVTNHLGLDHVADGMDVRRNSNKTSLQVSPSILKRLETLDQEIYDKY